MEISILGSPGFKKGVFYKSVCLTVCLSVRIAGGKLFNRFPLNSQQTYQLLRHCALRLQHTLIRGVSDSEAAGRTHAGGARPKAESWLSIHAFCFD